MMIQILNENRLLELQSVISDLLTHGFPPVEVVSLMPAMIRSENVFRTDINVTKFLKAKRMYVRWRKWIKYCHYSLDAFDNAAILDLSYIGNIIYPITNAMNEYLFTVVERLKKIGSCITLIHTNEEMKTRVPARAVTLKIYQNGRLLCEDETVFRHFYSTNSGDYYDIR